MPTNPETAPVLLDTSALIAHMIGPAKISERIKAAERCFLPLTALGELRQGVHKSQRQGRTKERQKSSAFYASPKSSTPATRPPFIKNNATA